jgi:hypothetical protein
MSSNISPWKSIHSPCNWIISPWKRERRRNGNGRIIGKGGITMIILRGMSLIINIVIDTVTRQGREWDLLGPLFPLIMEGVDDIQKLRKDRLAVVIVIHVCETFPPKFEYVFPLIVNGFIAW